MSDIQTTRTIDVVGAEIRALTATALTNIIEIGRRMCEAKELLEHGEFYPWIEQVAGYKKSTANNFMRLFKAYADPQHSLFGAEVGNLQTFGGLNYSKALALLEVPDEEREEFVQTHDVESMTTKQLEQAIRERDEARAELRETSELLEETSDKYAALTIVAREAEERVKELESRPVEVAVQVDEEAVKKAADEAQADADEHWKQEMDKLRKRLEGVEKKRDQLEQAAKKAEEKARTAAGEAGAEAEKAKAEAESLRAEVERLNKELAMSNKAVTVCQVKFFAWQQAFADLKKAFPAMDEEDKERFRAAIRKQLEAWSGALSEDPKREA